MAYAMEGMTVREMMQQQYELRRQHVMQSVDEVLNSEKCDLFMCLSNGYQLQTLYDQVELRTFEENEILISEGPGKYNEVMVHLRGRVLKQSRGVELEELDQYALIGHRAFLFQEAPLSLIACERTEVLVLKRALLDMLFGEDLPKVFMRSRLLSLLAGHKIFSRLHEEQREEIARACRVIVLQAHEEFFHEDLCFVTVLHGSVETRPTAAGTFPEVQCYSSAAKPSFGEDCLVDRKKSWTLRLRATDSTTSVQLAVWHRQDLDSVINFDNLDTALEEGDKVRTLKSVLIFKTLPMQQLRRLASTLRIRHLAVGDEVFKQGDPGRHLYVVRRGAVLVAIGSRKIREIGLGDYFGERALLSSEPRSATVTATEDSQLWEMDKETFSEVIRGPCLEYLRARIALQEDAQKVTLVSLEFIRIIGRGGFGVVKMVRAKNSGERYALKCVKKRHIVDHGLQKSLLTELSILAEADHPFIIKFVRPFRNATHVFYLTEIVTGGELLDALDSLGILNHSQAQFYSGSILLALEFLHARHIAYLDLKSENCLIDHMGYIKIIDFGIAQRMTRAPSRLMLGTPIIMAPEVILGKGYTTVADLWSLGVCLYDFVIGQIPFGGSNCATKVQVYEEVLRGELAFPKALRQQPHGPDTVALLQGLLTRDPAKRLGAGFEGYNTLKNHPFFIGLEWDMLLGREIVPPFIPDREIYGEDREQVSAESSPAVPAMLAEEDAENSDPEWVDPEPG